MTPTNANTTVAERSNRRRLASPDGTFQSTTTTMPTTDTITPSAATACADQLREIREFYDRAGDSVNWAGRHYRRLLAKYYRRMIPEQASVLEIGCGSGSLLGMLPNRDVTGIDLSPAQVELARQSLPHGKFYVQAGEELTLDRTYDYIIISDTINQAADVQTLFECLRKAANPKTRLILNFYNTAWRPILGIASLLGWKAPQPPSNWLSPTDVENLLELAGWSLIKQQYRGLLPVPALGLDKLLNRFVAPLVPWLNLTVFQIARPAPAAIPEPKSVTVVIPARNEAGNIRAAIARMPQLGSRTEVIFVEGHSKDDTWETIERVMKDFDAGKIVRTSETGDTVRVDAAQGAKKLEIVAIRQSGKGKGNAVREAFDIATGDILMILDADLTVPPEDLPKFYNALAGGKTEFANGVRLVYPMEKRAMRFLNLCANRFFGLSFSWSLGQSIKDTLCGTKVLFRDDYRTIAANRAYFGDFDPFGDFDLLFGADRLNMKITDIPIRYRERTYGETNISRFRHGALLFRMLWIAIRKLKLG